MKTLFDVRIVFWRQNAVFRVPTQRAGDAFMRVVLDEYGAGENSIVEVDAERFLELWRQKYSSHPEIAAGNPSSWPGDRKFSWAVDGFAHGEKNPVPLAEVGCHIAHVDIEEHRRRNLFFRKTVVVGSTSSPFLGITDGVTRTIWLLTQGAQRFPVHCSRSEADLLHELAGIAGGRPWSFAELAATGR
jgi:hypothetical protein